MKNLENMTKKELLEVIDNKEEELGTLRERLASVEEQESLTKEDRQFHIQDDILIIIDKSTN